MSQIFISYSRRDADCVQRTVQRLAARGYRVWFDKQSIPGGADWKAAIREGVRAASVTLLFWSADAAGSQYVGEEVQLALRKVMNDEMTLITVRLDDTPLTDDIRDYNALKLANCEATTGFAALLPHLPDDVRRTLAPPERSVPLGEQDDATELETVELVRVPLATSAYASAVMVGPAEVRVKDIFGMDAPRIGLAIECLGGVNDEQFIRKAVTYHQENLPDDAPLLFLHVRGPAEGESFQLPNDDPGPWLDTANFTHDAAEALVGRGGASVDLYIAAPSVLSFVIGTRFGKFWRMYMHNLIRNGNPPYMQVMDTHDL